MVGKPADAAPSTDSPPPRRGALWYRLEPQGQTLSVQMRLLQPPPTATFFLPGPWAGRGDFDELISLGQARGPEGPLPIRVDRSQGRIDVSSHDAEWIEVTYHVHTGANRQELHRFSPWQSGEGFFAYAPTILVLPSAGVARQLLDIPVEVHVPGDWEIAHTWPLRHHEVTEDGAQVAGFVADDVRSLRDAFIAAGSGWTILDHRLPQGRLSLTLSGEFEFEAEQLLDIAAEICGDYLDQFGLYEDISIFVMPVPDKSKDTLRGSGRRGGFVLEIPAEQDMDEQLLLLMAHEAFHMWNGHHLVPHPEATEEVAWFKEGVTHYVALKTLARLGLVDDRAVRRELALAAQHYLRNPIIAGGEVRALDRRRLPYDQGVLIALALELNLFEASDGTMALEDWIDLLLSNRFAGEIDAYDEEVLRKSFESLTASFGAAPLRTYDDLVRRGETISVQPLFRQLGLHYLDNQRPTPARLLPLDEGASSFHEIFFQSGH